jgi:hypothetical protein
VVHFPLDLQKSSVRRKIKNLDVNYSAATLATDRRLILGKITDIAAFNLDLQTALFRGLNQACKLCDALAFVTFPVPWIYLTYQCIGLRNSALDLSTDEWTFYVVLALPLVVVIFSTLFATFMYICRRYSQVFKALRWSFEPDNTRVYDEAGNEAGLYLEVGERPVWSSLFVLASVFFKHDRRRMAISIVSTIWWTAMLIWWPDPRQFVWFWSREVPAECLGSFCMPFQAFLDVVFVCIGFGPFLFLVLAFVVFLFASMGEFLFSFACIAPWLFPSDPDPTHRNRHLQSALLKLVVFQGSYRLHTQQVRS